MKCRTCGLVTSKCRCELRNRQWELPAPEPDTVADALDLFMGILCEDRELTRRTGEIHSESKLTGYIRRLDKIRELHKAQAWRMQRDIAEWSGLHRERMLAESMRH